MSKNLFGCIYNIQTNKESKQDSYSFATIEHTSKGVFRLLNNQVNLIEQDLLAFIVKINLTKANYINFNIERNRLKFSPSEYKKLCSNTNSVLIAKIEKSQNSHERLYVSCDSNGLKIETNPSTIYSNTYKQGGSLAVYDTCNLIECESGFYSSKEGIFNNWTLTIEDSSLLPKVEEYLQKYNKTICESSVVDTQNNKCPIIYTLNNNQIQAYSDKNIVSYIPNDLGISIKNIIKISSTNKNETQNEVNNNETQVQDEKLSFSKVLEDLNNLMKKEKTIGAALRDKKITKVRDNPNKKETWGCLIKINGEIKELNAPELINNEKEWQTKIMLQIKALIGDGLIDITSKFKEFYDKYNGFECCKRSDYTVEVRPSVVGEKYYNQLEDCWYTGSSKEGEVLTIGTVGEKWLQTQEKIIKKYTKEDGTELTNEDFKGFKSIKVRPKEDSAKCWAVKIPFEVNKDKYKIKTSWAELKINCSKNSQGKSFDHGDGDYLISYDESFSSLDVINGIIFSKTYQKYKLTQENQSNLEENNLLEELTKIIDKEQLKVWFKESQKLQGEYKDFYIKTIALQYKIEIEKLKNLFSIWEK